MNINEILTQAKPNGTEGLQAAIDSLRKIVDEHEMAVIAAIDAYYAGMAQREDAVKQRLDALEAQQRKIDSDINATGSALAQAAVSGDNTQLERIQTKLSDLEARDPLPFRCFDCFDHGGDRIACARCQSNGVLYQAIHAWNR